MTSTSAASRVKVLFVAGSGRSGSTVLANILGQVEGFVSAGELRYIWERGFIQGRTCGCGRPVNACPFWSDVMIAAFGDPPRVDPATMVALQRRGTRMRHVPMMGGTRGRRLLGRMGGYPARTGALYRAIQSSSGCNVIIDSSKLPSYGHVLSHLSEVDLRVLHLVRDPRATAYSWLRRKAAPDRPGGLMQRQGPVRSAALWTAWNWTAERLWGADPARYRLVRYEDFVRSPAAVLERIIDFLGEAPRTLPFLDETTVRLSPTHSVAGNPSRFETGQVQLHPDDEWRLKMPAWQRLLVTALTFPLMRRYGYRPLGRAAG